MIKGTVKTKVNLKSIDKKIDSLSKATKTNLTIGIHKKDNQIINNGLTLADLLLIHINGSITNNLPARDPLFRVVERNKDEIIAFLVEKIENLKKEKKDFQKEFEYILEQLGFLVMGMIRAEFSSGGNGEWTDLKEATWKRKITQLMLVETGAMRDAIKPYVNKK